MVISKFRCKNYQTVETAEYFVHIKKVPCFPCEALEAHQQWLKFFMKQNELDYTKTVPNLSFESIWKDKDK